MKKILLSIISGVVFLVLFCAVSFLLDKNVFNGFTGNPFEVGVLSFFYVPAIAFAVSFHTNIKKSFLTVIIINLVYAVLNIIFSTHSDKGMVFFTFPFMVMVGLIGTIVGGVCQWVYKKIVLTQSIV
jgi:hypothetical protein